jgi:hypothetical protein
MSGDGAVSKMRAATEGLRKAAEVSFTVGKQGADGSSKTVGWPFGNSPVVMETRTESSKVARAVDLEGMTQQVAEWDSEMDSIDRKQGQLLNEQWRLLRSQIGTLMAALAEMKTELSDLKENVVMKSFWPELEKVIENFIASHEQHAGFSEQMTARMVFLEDFVGESLTKTAEKDLHKTSMESRVEYLEALIGDSADKHVKEIGIAASKLDSLHKAVAECAKLEHQNSIDNRIVYLENFIGESADKHDKDISDAKRNFVQHTTTMETRLEFVEGLVGDSADKHGKEIAAANDKMHDLNMAIRACATAENHANLEQRLAYLEKFLGESAYQHEKEVAATKKEVAEQKTAVETRLEYIETLLGDSANKHAKYIHDAESRLGNLHKAIEACAKVDHHASLEQRMDYLEGYLGENADKKGKHQATVETRLEYVENFIGDSAEKHAKDLSFFQNKFGDLHEAVSACARSEHHQNLEMRVENLERRPQGGSVKVEIDENNVSKAEFQRSVKSIWEALDTHTHDVDVGSLQRFPQPTTVTRPMPVRTVSPVTTVMAPPAQTVIPTTTTFTPPTSPVAGRGNSLRTSLTTAPGTSVIRSISPGPTQVSSSSLAAPVAVPMVTTQQVTSPITEYVSGYPGTYISGAATPGATIVMEQTAPLTPSLSKRGNA